MARVAVATDNFNRANGGLGANWGNSPDEGGTPQISSNAVTNSASDQDGTAYYSGASFNDAQYAKATMVTFGDSGGTYMGVVVRGSTTNAVLCQKNAPDNTVKIVWYNGTDWTTIASGAYVVSNGEIFIGEAEGTTFRLYIEDVLIISGTNASAPSSGAPGLSVNENTDVIDDWEGGNLVASTRRYSLTLLGVG